MRTIVIPELEALPDVGYQFWSQDDKAILTSYYGKKETNAIAEYLGKRPNAVRNMVTYLGLSFSMTDKERAAIIDRIERGEL